MGSLCSKPPDDWKVSFNVHTQTFKHYSQLTRTQLTDEKLYFYMQYAYPNESNTVMISENHIHTILVELSSSLNSRCDLSYFTKQHDDLQSFCREVLVLICLQDVLQFQGFYVDIPKKTIFLPQITSFRTDKDLCQLAHKDQDLRNALLAALEKIAQDTVQDCQRDALLCYEVKKALILQNPSLFIKDIARQLCAIHAEGFAHDDIKLDNCIFDVTAKKWSLIDYDIASPLGLDWGYRGTPGFYAASGPSSRS